MHVRYTERVHQLVLNVNQTPHCRPPLRETFIKLSRRKLTVAFTLQLINKHTTLCSTHATLCSQFRQQSSKSSYRSVDPQTLRGNVHQVDHVPNGPINSAAITTMFPLRLCGGEPLVAVTRERRYGPTLMTTTTTTTKVAQTEQFDHSATRLRECLPSVL